jgi:hypothetical protein
MIGVGTFELAVGVLLAAFFVYFVFRDRRLVVLIPLLIVLSLVFGVFVALAEAWVQFFVALAVAWVRYGLFGG